MFEPKDPTGSNYPPAAASKPKDDPDSKFTMLDTLTSGIERIKEQLKHESKEDKELFKSVSHSLESA